MKALPQRRATAGVTLVEMLVVLTLFAVVSGAVVMALPDRRTNIAAQTSAAALAHDISRAVDLALAQGRGFGIAFEEESLRFLQRTEGGAWRAHEDPHLAEVKLFPVRFRIFEQNTATDVPFGVSPTLVPDQGQPLELVFENNGSVSRLTYDGMIVRVENGEGD